MSTADLPFVNATLNSIATVFILAGFICIKLGKKKAHGAVMTVALLVSAGFLTCYLIYHFTNPPVSSGHMGDFRPVYLTILITHVILAILNLPMIIVTVLAAKNHNWQKHRRWAKWTLPVWLYVSVTGVLVYFMLYVWYPAPSAA